MVKESNDVLNKIYEKVQKLGGNAEKDSIEKELGLALDWQRLDGKKASRIVYRIPGLDFDDHSNYDTLMNEAIDKIIDFSKVFKKYMK